MPILVVAATGLELCAALDAKAARPQGEIFACEAYGRPVLALVCGIGVVNAALALGRALCSHELSGVLNVGVAGSFDLDAHPLGAARLVEREAWPEYGLLFSGAPAADARALGFSLNGAAKTSGDAVFQELAWDANAELRSMGLPDRNMATATSLTVSGVSADAQRARALRERFGAGLENMEGFALAYGARQAGTNFAELRTVSNAVGSRPPQGWDLPGALAFLGRAARLLLAP